MALWRMCDIVFGIYLTASIVLGCFECCKRSSGRCSLYASQVAFREVASCLPMTRVLVAQLFGSSVVW
jgi:hypothetical protein